MGVFLFGDLGEDAKTNQSINKYNKDITKT